MDTLLSPEQRPERIRSTEETGAAEEAFAYFPSGAIAFFIALVLLCLAIWFGIYFLMIERA